MVVPDSHEVDPTSGRSEKFGQGGFLVDSAFCVLPMVHGDGRHVGQLKISKRGSSTARSYLYFAALRLIKNNPVAKAWYLNKVDPRAKNKTVIAVMRKLVKALWYVGRGERFDANKLFTLAKA